VCFQCVGGILRVGAAHWHKADCSLYERGLQGSRCSRTFSTSRSCTSPHALLQASAGFLLLAGCAVHDPDHTRFWWPKIEHSFSIVRLYTLDTLPTNPRFVLLRSCAVLADAIYNCFYDRRKLTSFLGTCSAALLALRCVAQSCHVCFCSVYGRTWLAVRFGSWQDYLRKCKSFCKALVANMETLLSYLISPTVAASG